MGARRTIRGLLGVAAAGAALVVVQALPGVAAGGDHTVSTTQTQHGTWTEQGDTDFCTNELISPTISGNSVFHITYFPAGDEVWGTFTTEGQASFLQPSSGLTFSGRVTVWGNFNVNNKNSNSTFTASFSATALDSAGVTHYEVGHQVMHIGYNAVDPLNPIVSFEKMRVTCS